MVKTQSVEYYYSLKMSEPDSVDLIEVIPREILDAADDVIYNAMPDKSKKNI